MIGWINLGCLIGSILGFCIMYTISLRPKALESKRGTKAWKECAMFRTIAGLLEFVIIINIILWIWFPVSFLDWRIAGDYLPGVLIGLAIIVPGMIIMVKGMMDAGKETMEPSKKTTMYTGIYMYIRHPQSLGEFPMFVAVAFMVNSWFLVIITAMFVVLYVPIMIYYEEKDLVLRFGDAYKEYQARTGALFPKWNHD